MNPSRSLKCNDFPCKDMVHDSYIVPGIQLDPDRVKMIMIAECTPPSAADYYYAKGEPLFAKTTLQAFQEAGEPVQTIQEIMQLGVYLTTAVKCGKKQYLLSKESIQNCSLLLERELALFPNAKVLLLMGDVAIHAINCIAKRNGQPRPIPPGSTYKIRAGKYHLNGIRLFPSYLQAGPSYFIEKTKRRMISEDIASGFKLLRSTRKG